VEAGGAARGLGPNEVAIPLGQEHVNRVRITGLEARNGQVVVEATANLSRVSHDRSFVWGLAVRPKRSSTPIRELRYDHQVGLDPKGDNSAPTFREQLEIPTGFHVITVRVYEVPPGGVQALEDEELRQRYTMASDSRDIVIP
jgi:hypothetical protein